MTKTLHYLRKLVIHFIGKGYLDRLCVRVKTGDVVAGRKC